MLKRKTPLSNFEQECGDDKRQTIYPNWNDVFYNGTIVDRILRCSGTAKDFHTLSILNSVTRALTARGTSLYRAALHAPHFIHHMKGVEYTYQMEYIDIKTRLLTKNELFILTKHDIATICNMIMTSPVFANSPALDVQPASFCEGAISLWPKGHEVGKTIRFAEYGGRVHILNDRRWWPDIDHGRDTRVTWAEDHTQILCYEQTPHSRNTKKPRPAKIHLRLKAYDYEYKPIGNRWTRMEIAEIKRIFTLVCSGVNNE